MSYPTELNFHKFMVQRVRNLKKLKGKRIYLEVDYGAFIGSVDQVYKLIDFYKRFGTFSSDVRPFKEFNNEFGNKVWPKPTDFDFGLPFHPQKPVTSLPDSEELRKIILTEQANEKMNDKRYWVKYPSPVLVCAVCEEVIVKDKEFRFRMVELITPMDFKDHKDMYLKLLHLEHEFELKEYNNIKIELVMHRECTLRKIL